MTPVTSRAIEGEATRQDKSSAEERKKAFRTRSASILQPDNRFGVFF
jgi:hypothetical protein